MPCKEWNLIHHWIQLGICHLGPFLISLGFEKTVFGTNLYILMLLQHVKIRKTLGHLGLYFLTLVGYLPKKNESKVWVHYCLWDSCQILGLPYLISFLSPHPHLLLWPLKQEWELTDWRATEEKIIKLTTCSTVKCSDNTLKGITRRKITYFSFFFFSPFVLFSW